MRINHNIAALKANNMLNTNDSKLSKSLEKLTSGLKINHASDDAAGMAISQKMKTQIAGLSKASNNASDGISVIQTAEGALEEVNSCLQRMRELSVQAANGIYTTDDRIAIQKEIDALNNEITRISENTEFNTRHLLDGSIDRKAFSNSTSINIVSISDSVPTADKYEIKITQDARQAVLVGDSLTQITDITAKITKTEAGKININGLDIEVKEGDTYDEVFKQLRDTCADLDIYCFATDSELSCDYGEDIYAGYRAEKFGAGGLNLTTPQKFIPHDLTHNISDLSSTTEQTNITLTIDGTEYTGSYKATSTPEEGELTLASGGTVKIKYAVDGSTQKITKLELSASKKINVPEYSGLNNLKNGNEDGTITLSNGDTPTVYTGKVTTIDENTLIIEDTTNSKLITIKHDGTVNTVATSLSADDIDKITSVSVSPLTSETHKTYSNEPTTTILGPYTNPETHTVSTGITDIRSNITETSVTLTIDSTPYTGDYKSDTLDGGTGTFTITSPGSGDITITYTPGSTTILTATLPDSTVVDFSTPTPTFTSLSNIKAGETAGTITINGTTYTGSVTADGSSKLIITTASGEKVNISHDGTTSATDPLSDVTKISEVTVEKTDTSSLAHVFESSLENGKNKFLTIDGTTYTGTMTVVAPNQYTLHAFDGNIFNITTDGTPESIVSVEQYKDTNPTQRLAFVSYSYGSDEKISILCNNPELSKLFGLSTNTLESFGIDAKAALIANPDNGYSNTATVSIYGNKVTVSDNNNFEMVIETKPGVAKTKFKDDQIHSNTNSSDGHKIELGAGQNAVFTVLDAGPLSLQIGANAYQTMEVSIPAVTPKILGVDTVNVGTEDGSQKAIEAVSIAINTVSSIRAKLGAFQNRLEHAISNLNTTNENMTESLSRIEDTDMAGEMAQYTQKSILVQAGTSMLAQANQQPQSILSLLQR